MVALWAYPHRIPYLKSQGYQPIPDYCFHNDYNGGRPIIPSDPTAKLRDGLMVREPGACEVVALWTTCSNDRRCKENEAHAAQERILGRSVRNQGVIDGAVTSADQIWQKNNITPYEEDVVTSGFAQAPGKQNGRPLAAKMPA